MKKHVRYIERLDWIKDIGAISSKLQMMFHSNNGKSIKTKVELIIMALTQKGVVCN